MAPSLVRDWWERFSRNVAGCQVVAEIFHYYHIGTDNGRGRGVKKDPVSLRNLFPRSAENPGDPTLNQIR
jgi:hypothetical protein